MFGGIEAGGTKFVCGVGTAPGDLRRVELPTTSPESTISRACEALQGLAAGQQIKALGLACFGPVDLVRESRNYGKILATPKPGWSNFDIVAALEEALRVPVALETDVNAALLAETVWGACRGVENAIYLTVGTGIGGGIIIKGSLVHGSLHPEIGHILVPHDKYNDPFEGTCPFHKDCLEGLASGPAMYERWGTAPSTLPDEHEAWELEASYLAAGLLNLVFTVSPQRIVIGGGVGRRMALLSLIRRKLLALANGYSLNARGDNNLIRFIVSPGLGEDSGVLGAIHLARVFTGSIHISRRPS